MLAAALSALLLGAAPPCGPIDLETALALALEHSDQIAIRQAEAAAARADLSLARALRVLPSGSATLLAGPAPRARGDVVSSPDSNRSFSDLGPFGRVDVQVVQPLYTWGRLQAASDAAGAGARARELLVGSAAGEVQLRVVQLYWGAALARRLVAVASEVETALAEADRRIEASLAAGDGVALLSDRYRVDLFRALLRSRTAEANKGLDQARIGLAALFGTVPGRLDLREEPLPTAQGEVPNEPAAVAEAERRRPDLRAADEAIAARDAEIRAAEAEMLPQLFLAGTFSYGYAPNRDQQRNPWVRDDFNLLTLGVGIGLRQDLALPMLSARVRQARAARETLARQRAGLARLVQVEVDGAIAEVTEARARLSAAQAALGSGRALFRSSALDFSAGLIEARSLIEAYGLYVESQVGAARASYDLLVARARLAQVVGEPPRKGTACELR